MVTIPHLVSAPEGIGVDVLLSLDSFIGEYPKMEWEIQGKKNFELWIMSYELLPEKKFFTTRSQQPVPQWLWSNTI